MRILHTADLHLGHSLNGWDRELEHQLWFDRLADIVEQEEIDLLLIAGDIYDNTNPSGEIQKLFYRGLTKLKGRRPSLRTVISGGNHDPVRRLEAPGVLLSEFDVHVVGGVHRKESSETGELVFDLDQHLISIPVSVVRVVRRQGFWVQWRPKLRESLAHLVGLIMRHAGDDASVALRVSSV